MDYTHFGGFVLDVKGIIPSNGNFLDFLWITVMSPKNLKYNATINLHYNLDKLKTSVEIL